MSEPVQAARLQEAREYLGFSRKLVAEAAGWPVAVVADFEDGMAVPTAGQLVQLGELYRRPLAWFSGETTFEPGADLLRKVEHLTEGDREAVLDFAEWLQGAGPSSPPRRPER